MGKRALYLYHKGKKKLETRKMSICGPHLHLITTEEVNVWSVLLTVLADQQQDRRVPCLIQHCLTVMDCGEREVLQLLLLKGKKGMMGNVKENKKTVERERLTNQDKCTDRNITKVQGSELWKLITYVYIIQYI